ncbi:MAG: DUF2442 domain-containing protein [Muribaculaceae bacterium]|nr:DUF2442 domain-containing protein [Muribaculaceae bacterium]
MLKVKKSEYGGGYSIICTFNNGEKKKVDISALFHLPIFAELKDMSEFLKFGLDPFTVCWDNGADIAPNYLYTNGVAIS